MRRDGCKFAIRTNHTLRSSPCVVSRRRSGFGNCGYHSRDLFQYSYRCISEESGLRDAGREEVWGKGVEIAWTQGSWKMRWQACAVGTAAWKARIYHRHKYSRNQGKSACKANQLLDISESLICY